MKKRLTVWSIAFATLLMLSISVPQIKAKSISTMGGTDWTKYSGNPLNSLGTGCNEASSVIFDGTTYKMWFSKSDGIYYASSSDGISWTTPTRVLEPGASGSWETTVGPWSCVVYDGTLYRMWYTGYYAGVNKIGYATSSNGINWVKYSGNPVLVPGGNGGWDDWNTWGAKVHFDGSLYRMWYTAEQVRDGTHRIGLATSSDGITWTKYSNNPVIVPGPSGWDNLFVDSGPVIKEGDVYLMWYTALCYPPAIWRIGLARSLDGVTWEKYAGNPVLNPGSAGSWDSKEVIRPSVTKVGNTYKMWYVGSDGTTQKIGLAFSTLTLASLELVPNTGFATATLVGTGFSSNLKITVTWDGAKIPTVPSSLITDAYGNFTAIISVPTQNAPGTHTIKATDALGIEANATFTVIDMTGPGGPQGPQGPQGPPGETPIIVPAFTTAASILAICLATIALLKKKT